MRRELVARVPRLVRPISVAERIVLVVLLAVVVVVLFVLGGLDPDPRGLGTHEQLGMQPCGWPAARNMPCPTCGVTTSAVHLLHLQVGSAFRVQPFGALLTMAVLGFVVLGVLHLWRGESLFGRIALWPWGTISLVAVVVLLASWYYRVYWY